MSESAIAPVVREIAPPELVARAEALRRKFPGCFWYWDPDARIRYLDDLREVVLQLRKHGDREAWLAAQEFHKCL
ncbi:hypothetical protein [Luteolibacter sp. Populi]|uniref:hypothetical protein n=1 Tax=Luteolibacter sp. Populi TaxID=3230487 RepID=UPI0034670DF2